ncbi:DNA topoisomerase IB [Occultella glacieicola]|uniref:DNA topoisomerase n=1 Tax=Occultella glacieicola TaxID=2518684 RepID=A0ABY2E2D4_9MICO|nr:DNA topoisomerase IB [Occultella glacieicola]TDE92757.1 DNA topoisomerase IB [Occultella glacieicola]
MSGRLHRVDVDAPGWGRRRCGRGWVYLDTDGVRIAAAGVIARCRDLMIPPAWQEVWICPDETGHIQAVGTDAAGRRQYLYHPLWRARQDARKHIRVREIAARLPRARRAARIDLRHTGMPRDRALAVAFLLLDQGLFRIGSEAYTAQHGSFGLATLRKRHLRITTAGVAVFDYVAKSGVPRRVEITHTEVVEALRLLRRRRGGGPELLAYREGSPTRGPWHDLTSVDIGAYVKRRLGEDASAKDFRTWHGTVLAAVTLARGADDTGEAAPEDAVREAVSAVAERLGNTPAVSRSAYIDPQVLSAFEEEPVIATLPIPGAGEPVIPQPPRVETAVREMLEADDPTS